MLTQLQLNGWQTKDACYSEEYNVMFERDIIIMMGEALHDMPMPTHIFGGAREICDKYFNYGITPCLKIN